MSVIDQDQGLGRDEAWAVEERGAPGEVFRAFLRLGLTSFGGPIAHLGYFRDDLILRRRWLDETGFAELVALCQFLPGPASSQVGFSLGILRAGSLWGGAVAWLGFTAPSALVMLACAFAARAYGGLAESGVVHGLKLVAVAVIAQAVWGMARTLAPDRDRASVAVIALVLTLLLPGAVGQLGAIALGAVAGLILCRATGPVAVLQPLRVPISRRAGLVALAAFALLLAAPPLLRTIVASQGLNLFEAFYRAGALVFGGGHVVLPLLRAALVDPGWISPDTFLAGYGAAQAVPGPLFTVAAYLGAVSGPAPNGIGGAIIALIGIFLPGLLLVVGTLPFWSALRSRPAAQAAIRGTNAAVVGLLAAALYNPVWTSSITGPRDVAIAATAFVLLTAWRLPPWTVVVMTALAGLFLNLG